ncbi:MAG TPA: hypothetical protein VNI84_08350 [Pyrinomonadaceae bacterium]|nr:hypothetical protein [Pyrinomonadaceae bacterium]
MTDNQFNQLFDSVTKSVNGAQRLEKGQEVIRADIAELKTDVAELKEGQVKIDKSLQIVNRTLANIHGDWANLRSRVEILEDEKNLSL